MIAGKELKRSAMGRRQGINGSQITWREVKSK